jgi:ribonuclease D
MTELFVDTQTGLERLGASLAQQPWIALDTEFVRERTYYGRLCLLQLAVPGLVACVDPVALADLGPLMDIIYDAGVTKIMHAARQDLELLADLRGAPPDNVFDTQVAAALCGHGEQVGYGPLVDTLLGVKLPKAHTRTDWCRRPLSTEQIHYAEDDVRYLGALYEHLSARIAELGRSAWLEEELRRVSEPETYRSEPEEAWRRLKRGQMLPPAQQVVLRELATWRERRAQRSNLPRNWVARDEVLVALARRGPVSRRDLLEIQGLGAGAVRKWADAILETVARAQRLPPEEIWPRAGRPTAEQKARIDRLMDVARTRAEDLGIAPAIIATRREVEQLANGERDLDLLRGWRREAVGEALLAALTDQRRA